MTTNTDAYATSATKPAAVPRQAASLIVLRDAPGGPQVLLLRRADRPGDQNSGAAVFPGGMLDRADADAVHLCDGLDDAAASARLGVPSGGLRYWIAAVRECFEEAGILLARPLDNPPDSAQGLVALDAHGEPALTTLRRALHAGEINLEELCHRLGVRLALDELSYFAHWITPVGMPKIFDTRFFITQLPPGQTAQHDATETVELLWLTPAQALDKSRGLKLMNVTETTLKQLAGFADAAAAIRFAQAQTSIPLMRPRVGLGADGRRAVANPGDWPYAEIGRLDPNGRGDVCTALVPGRAVWLSPRVLRVTADNGSQMTGPGTNAYFIGAGDDWSLLDPGPDDADHVQALLAAAPGRISRILVTHTHKDHSPAAAAIAAATGAPTFGRVADHPEWQDTAFQPTQVLSHGDVLALAEGVTLRVVHTPGHASNHLCYLLEEEKLLFTGDHLMQGSTVVINPPDGNMVAYLGALEALYTLDLDWLAPGHGFLIDQPHQVVRKTIAHRLAREAKVLAAVDALGAADGGAHESALLATVYADTPIRLHAVALRSLRAHLDKLLAEGRVSATGGGWQRTGTAPAQA